MSTTPDVSGTCPSSGASEVSERIQRFVAGLGRLALGYDDPVFGPSGLNSLFAMQLIMFLERTFEIQVTDEDLELDNFRTINALAGFVARKQSALST